MHFKKFNRTLGALSLAALYTVTTLGATVTDVTNTHWAYSSIMALEKEGIMAFSANGQFFPNQLMDYFEVADVLAKATGYVDADVNKEADPALVAQIKANYEKQKPILQSYAAKYNSWNSAYNQQIAYLLGRGYLTVADLDRFITKTGTTEAKNIMTKEQLSIYVVKMLGKAVTAVETYTTTGFKDEESISLEARPYMAYLKKVGVLTPDAAGNTNSKTKVSKALCAKMVSSALQLKENTSTPNNGQTVPESSKPVTEGVHTATVKKVLTKNAGEYYLLLEIKGTPSYYTIKNTVKISKPDGSELPITKLVGEKLEVSLQMEGSTEYITSAKVVASEAAPETAPDTAPESKDEVVLTGKLAQPMTSGLCRIMLSDGTLKSYILDGDCTILLNGMSVEAKEIAENDTVTVTIEDNVVMKVVAASKVNDVPKQSSGQVLSKKLASGAYTFTVSEKGKEVAVLVPETAEVMRNGRKAELSEVRLGDTLSFTRTNGVVTEVKASSQRSKVEGTIGQIILGATNKVVINVNQKPVTYTLADDAEIYDMAIAEVISIRDLHLGQTAHLLLDSQEVISLDVDSKADSVNLMGTIVGVGKRAAYIDVLVDYDHLTGESKAYKRIPLENEVKVALNGKSKDIYDLEEEMRIVIDYAYLDDAMPEKILIIQ